MPPPAAFVRMLARAKRDGECLLAGSPDHYAKCWVDGKCVSAHRLACEAAHGPIPPGMWALHRCVARKSCIEPGHLYAGTPADNGRDTVAAGRSTRGERNAQAKLTEIDVRRARAMRATGMTIAKIAESLAIVTREVIGDAIAGRTWGHVQ